MPHAVLSARCTAVQALDGFSLCLWQLGEGEADTALAGTNVFPLLHRLSKEPNQLLRRSIITAVGALSHPGQSSHACFESCARSVLLGSRHRG